ncbi:hypothetical protein LCG60_19160 [Bacillus sp. SD-4]|nr:hypothetical protein LCG60_19160 [Bacillus sp. SD-4]
MADAPLVLLTDELPQGVDKINQGIKNANDALKKTAEPVSVEKLSEESKNRVDRGVFEVLGNLTDVKRNPDNSFTISFDEAYIWQGAGYGMKKIKGVSNLRVPDMQALVVDLSAANDEYTPYITTGNGYMSSVTHGKNGFVNDSKIILIGCYKGKVQGYLSKEMQKKKFVEDKLIINRTENVINIYTKGSIEGSNRYIHYILEHQVKGIDVTAAGSNYDVWRINGVYEVERKDEFVFNHIRQIVAPGEFELALREKGATDYIGGAIHGDQIMTSAHLFIDGVLTKTDASQQIACEELKFVYKSKLYRDTVWTNGELQQVGTSMRQYTFSKNGLEIDNEVQFLEEFTLTQGFLCMFPIRRLENGATGQQITSGAYRDYDLKVYDVSKDGFTHDLNTKRKGVKHNWLYSGSSKISADVEILERNMWLSDEGSWIANPVNYNKVYYDFCGNYTAAKGEVWRQKVRYRIDTLN